MYRSGDAAGVQGPWTGQMIVVDLVDARLEKAKELGATAVINSKEKDVFQEVERLTGGRGGDVVFETAGSAVTIAQTPFW